MNVPDNQFIDVAPTSRRRVVALVAIVGLALCGFTFLDDSVILLALGVVCGSAIGTPFALLTAVATAALLAIDGAPRELWLAAVIFLLAGMAVRTVHRWSLARVGAIGRSILVIIVAGVSAAIAAEVLHVDSSRGQVHHLQSASLIASAVIVGAVLSQYRRQRELGRLLTAPLATLVGSLAAVAATLAFWSNTDTDALRGAADSAAVGFVTVLTEQSNVISTKVNSENAAALYTDDFSSFIEVTVLGQAAISSASLVAVPADGDPEVITTVTELGEPNELSIAAWVRSQGDVLRIVTTDQVQLDLGITALDTLLEQSQNFYTVAAPLQVLDGTPGTPTVLVVTFSLDVALRTAAASATANEAAIELDFLEVNDGRAQILASTDPTRDNTTIDEAGLSLQGYGQQTTQVVLGDIDFRVRANFGGADLLRSGERQAVLIIEVILGLVMAALVFLLRIQSDRREHDRIRREALLAAALQGSPGWTAIIDGNDRVEMTNSGRFHVGQGELVAASPLWGDDPTTLENLTTMLVRARAGEASTMQVLWSDPADITLSMRIVEVAARPLPGIRLAFLQCIDVTEMRDRAMRTSQSERMEAIGVLAGGLAHDFNNLLFITLGYLQMLERQPIVSGDPQARTYVGRAVEAVERGAKVAKSLLSFARSQPLAASRVELDDYIKDLTPLIEQAIGSAHQLRIEVEGDQLGVIVDPGRLSSGLLNVVFNARDAMETKGQLTLRIAREIAAPLEQDPRPVIAISISDTGKGMSPEVAARAFEPFFTTKKVGSGTGLGLATLYSFAQQSGGWAAIDSTEGIGTTITLYLPPADVDQADEIAEERDTTLTTRALVLDDEPALADLVSAWLGDLGIATRTANTPEAALRVAREFKPQLVMSDANLNADLDGLEVARMLVEEHPSLIVVFMTGFSDRIKALQAAGVATLAKPFSREDLLSTLSKTAGLRWERGPRG